MLTKSGTKLLDFGLAKVREAASSAHERETALPTRELTTEGTILGTFQYMAPEQLEGKKADARSDVFAFGAVLYEMVTGRHAFTGASQASLIASILKESPPAIGGADVGTKSGALAWLERVIQTCLAKDPDARWQSAGDLGRELKWIAEGRDTGTRAARTTGGGSLAWATAALMAVIAAGVSWMHWREPQATQNPVRFTVMTDATLARQPSVSPDSRLLAFVGQNARGTSMIWVRPLDQPVAQPLAGTEGARFSFWSPDSRRIGFFDSVHQKLKTIDVGGGQAQILADVGFAQGGDWGADDTILYAPQEESGLFRIPAAGGRPVQVTAPAVGTLHSFPRFLPDGRHYLFIEKAFYFANDQNETLVRLGSLDSKESQRLALGSPFGATYAPGSSASGRNGPHLFFVQDGALMAQELDQQRFQLRGDPVRIADAVAVDGPYRFADFSVSRDGMLAFNASVHQHEVIWMDRAGNRIGNGIPAERYAHPALSPDGSRGVIERVDPKTGALQLWQFDTRREDLSLFDRLGTIARFTPDGNGVVWTCRIDGRPQFCRKAAGGAGRTESLWDSGENKVLVDVSRDGKYLSYTDTAKRFELWILPLTGERKPYRFYPTDSPQFHGQFSPDGQRIAYTSNETGVPEVYVQPFPATRDRWKISVNGGAQPAWRRDGTELFYRTGDGRMMAVAVKTAPEFSAGEPKMLFQSSADPLYPNLGIPFAVSPDGQRFLMNVAVDEARNPPITIVMNWAAGAAR